MITSVRNPRVQWVRKLQAGARARRQDQVFVVEGVRLLEEALQAQVPIKLVLYTAGLSPRALELVYELQRCAEEVQEVSVGVLKAASETGTPQGILAVVAVPELTPPAVVDFILVLDSLRDPGNVGTLLRTAAAAGVQSVLLTPGTADPYAPKVVRAGMGAHFRLPVQERDWEGIRRAIPAGMQVFLADSRDGVAYTKCNLRQPLALVIGGEAAGAGSPAHALADDLVHIPMSGEVESLNAAVAAAILLFEVVRQRSG